MMPLFTSKKQINDYSKTSGMLWQYINNGTSGYIIYSKLFKFKAKVAGKFFVNGYFSTIEIHVTLI